MEQLRLENQRLTEEGLRAQERALKEQRERLGLECQSSGTIFYRRRRDANKKEDNKRNDFRSLEEAVNYLAAIANIVNTKENVLMNDIGKTEEVSKNNKPVYIGTFKVPSFPSDNNDDDAVDALPNDRKNPDEKIDETNVSTLTFIRNSNGGFYINLDRFDWHSFSHVLKLYTSF